MNCKICGEKIAVDEAIDSGICVKCQVFLAELEKEEFEDWVDGQVALEQEYENTTKGESK